MLVQVYVDDIIFGSTKKELCNKFKKLMHEKFQTSFMGELTFFLGLQVKQKNDGIFISQDKYVSEILKKFGFTEVKNASTSTETQKPLLKDEDGEEVDVHMYRSMIGSLMYLTSSRHNIMFSACACARYQVNPKVSHLYAVKKIFRYLKGQPKLGLWYPKDSPFDLIAYTDSDYTGASLDMKSTTRGRQFLGCKLISWQCKKQTVVANSTTKAKYVAASSCFYQMDVKSAFLYGTIDEEVYVMQPPRFQDPEFLAKVYKVEKAMGMIDQTLFIRRQRGDFILVQVYVDDIIFGSSNPQLYREFEALMHEKFQMSTMGDILKKFGYSDVRSSNTPMDKENPWGKDGIGKDVDLHLYRSMIGSLMYLTASRPNIMFAICACARHQVTPKECHLHAVKRIFRYLKGHPKLGLWYPKESPFDLVAYSDSDYGGATQDQKSTTGGCQFLGRRLIS
nr:uncharacterized mitochondrial protein AtMg00810-like [Tanacetum cinerariifolium]